MTMPSITVVIPVYNAEKVIIETLISLTEQSHRDWKCVLINDGSTDNSLGIIQEFIDANSQHSFEIHSTPNFGPGNARNLGITLSSTPYIAFLDQDDKWNSEKLALQLQFLNLNTDCAAVLCDFEIVKAKNKLGNSNNRLIRNLNLDDLARGWLSLEGNGGHLSSGFMFRNNSDTNSVKFNSRYRHVADLDFFLKFHEKFKIGYQPINLVSYTQHSNQMHSDPTLLKYEYPLLLSEIDASLFGISPKRVLGNVFAMAAILDIRNRKFALAISDFYRALRTNPASIVIIPLAIFRKRVRALFNSFITPKLDSETL